ncbi:MAG: Uma2 family endonuclease [Clostridium sp.]
MLAEKRKFTIEEVEKLYTSDELVELINGEIFMQASPSIKHQRISMKLSTKLSLYFDGKKCEPFAAPIDVILSNDEEVCENKVIPDLIVVCDKDGLNENNYKGIPSLIIEIVSPSNSHHDYIRKLNLYERFGVLEYWIVDPRFKSIQIYYLNDGESYEITGVFKGNEVMESNIFKGLTVNLEDLFN